MCVLNSDRDGRDGRLRLASVFLGGLLLGCTGSWTDISEDKSVEACSEAFEGLVACDEDCSENGSGPHCYALCDAEMQSSCPSWEELYVPKGRFALSEDFTESLLEITYGNHDYLTFNFQGASRNGHTLSLEQQKATRTGFSGASFRSDDGSCSLELSWSTAQQISIEADCLHFDPSGVYDEAHSSDERRGRYWHVTSSDVHVHHLDIQGDMGDGTLSFSLHTVFGMAQQSIHGFLTPLLDESAFNYRGQDCELDVHFTDEGAHIDVVDGCTTLTSGGRFIKDVPTPSGALVAQSSALVSELELTYANSRIVTFNLSGVHAIRGTELGLEQLTAFRSGPATAFYVSETDFHCSLFFDWSDGEQVMVRHGYEACREWPDLSLSGTYAAP